MEGYIEISQLRKLFSAQHQKKFIGDQAEIETSHILMLDKKFGGEIIVNKKIKGKKLSATNVAVVKFYNCHFDNCDLTGSLFWMCTFDKCIFENCILDRVVFRKCEINSTIYKACNSRFYLNMSEGYIYDTTFNKCSFEGVEISGTDTFDVEFDQCGLSMGRFQANFTFRSNLSLTPVKYLSKEDKKLLKSKEIFDDVVYRSCLIDFMDFRMMDFVDTKFLDSEISKCSFNDCTLYDYNIDASNNKKGWGTNSIDLSTLNNSQLVPASTLKNIFNVDNHTQSKIKELLRKKIISSVFISYSLRDKEIANNINDYLKTAGVTTFLWERDAPGGMPLKSIMKSGIDAKDRILFIASENSLKSEACHFELTQGRLKQDKLWKTILFPIHIDNFLFEVEYEQIRPKNKRDEFWENIKELREVNSLNFSEFKNGISKKKKQFNQAMEVLVESLKIQ